MLNIEKELAGLTPEGFVNLNGISSELSEQNECEYRNLVNTPQSNNIR